MSPPIDDHNSNSDKISSFRQVPRTGVIYVTSEAARHGYNSGHPEWCNLGQGQPETGPLEGSPERIKAVEMDPEDQEYAPVAGVWELREAVAGLYNQLYRRGMPTQYSAENVSISGGGRSALTRAAAALGRINLGHFLPDYTAYEELLDVFGLVSPIPVLLEPEKGYRFTPDELRREILGRGLGAVLLSNPCNPTGRLLCDEELNGWVSASRDIDCALLIDEFYSHYIWKERKSKAITVSAAAQVEDVNKDPVVIFDGLTKNWRYPAWRCGWTVAPRKVIEAVVSAGSFLDGGGARPLQYAALELVKAEHALQEAAAIQKTFGKKRQLLIDGLRNLGFHIDLEPEGTFYVWASAANLPAPLDDSMAFFRAALTRKVICVPGVFFDINPGKRRPGRVSRFRQHIRFSFGPSEDSLVEALKRLESLISDARNGRLAGIFSGEAA